MAKTNISWTDAEKKVLDLIQLNEVSFLQYCTENWQVGLFLTSSGTSGLDAKLRIRHSYHPRIADEILVISRAIGIKVTHDSNWNLGKGVIGDDDYKKVDFLEKVRITYRSKIKKAINWEAHGSSVGKVTKILRELLERGFINHMDLEIEKGDYYIQAPFKLRFKHSFASRISAKKAFRRFAIDYLCTINKY